MIEEVYVSFETAKLAKEKGFNEEISTLYKNGIFKHHKQHHSNNPFISNMGMTDNCCSAPTQSLLARWLREKHNLFIETTVDFMRLIREGDSTKYYHIYYYKIVNLKNADYTNNKEEFHSYEKALEAGLQEALKLLP